MVRFQANTTRKESHPESEVRQPVDQAAIMDFTDAANAPGFLYILQEGKPNTYYKVGTSKDWETLPKRIANLQCGNWRELKLEKCSKVSNMNTAEKYAHGILEDEQVIEGGGTEWFKGDFKTMEAAVDAAATKYPARRQ